MASASPPGTPSVASSGPCSPWTTRDAAIARRLGKRVHWSYTQAHVREYEANVEEEEGKAAAWAEIKRRKSEAQHELRAARMARVSRCDQ